MICHRPSCSKKLIDLPDSPNYLSISIRCKCGARYRLSHKAGEHNIEKVNINDLNLATVAHVKHSDMRPDDKVYILDDIIDRSGRAEIASRESLRALVQVAT